MDDDIIEDPLGFTKQTSLLLAGAGCADYIKEFHKRNISSDDLSYLTLQDIKALGVNEEEAEVIAKKLQGLPKRRSNALSPQYRFNHAVDLLKTANQWMPVLIDFLIYNRLKLKEEKGDFFLEPNENLRATEALLMAISATMDSINDYEKELGALESYALQVKENPLKRIAKLCFLLSSFGTLVYFAARRFSS